MMVYTVKRAYYDARPFYRQLLKAVLGAASRFLPQEHRTKQLQY